MTTNQSSPDLSRAAWRKSSFSANQGNCIEVADGYAGIVPVRDSKDPSGPALAFPTDAWTAFIAAIKADELPTT
ncbi:DUF397 domain-containing protein [Kitasatospora sp. NPDC048194]|uniref:DUF397 domain-containing protein n=1 Tax=Kitasatospora sp. NPDC048194 TaxID=3364045 RepID=UPI003718EF30